MVNEYKKYNLLLDPADTEEAALIKFLIDNHGNKHKNSYSAILKRALILLKAADEKEGK